MAKINELLDPNNYSFRIKGHARICWAKNFFYIAVISAFFINPEHTKNISFACFLMSSVLYTLGVKPVFKINTKNSIDHE
tara:strand:+ start:3264 stop:3503 length:240 start_codon:yes stop_codon:yes gene_type:complete